MTDEEKKSGELSGTAEESKEEAPKGLSSVEQDVLKTVHELKTKRRMSRVKSCDVARVGWRRYKLRKECLVPVLSKLVKEGYLRYSGNYDLRKKGLEIVENLAGARESVAFCEMSLEEFKKYKDALQKSLPPNVDLEFKERLNTVVLRSKFPKVVEEKIKKLMG